MVCTPTVSQWLEQTTCSFLNSYENAHFDTSETKLSLSVAYKLWKLSANGICLNFDLLKHITTKLCQIGLIGLKLQRNQDTLVSLLKKIWNNNHMQPGCNHKKYFIAYMTNAVLVTLHSSIFTGQQHYFMMPQMSAQSPLDKEISSHLLPVSILWIESVHQMVS